MNTLFTLPDPTPKVETVTRYVIRIDDLEDGSVSYYRRISGERGAYGSDEFISLSEPIKVRGQKLPKMYKSYRGAQSRVADLYSRHKKRGEGIRIQVEGWTRNADDSEWNKP